MSRLKKAFLIATVAFGTAAAGFAVDAVAAAEGANPKHERDLDRAWGDLFAFTLLSGAAVFSAVSMGPMSMVGATEVAKDKAVKKKGQLLLP